MTALATRTVIPVSAVIPTRNRVLPISRMLRSLHAQDTVPSEIVIIDASSDDLTWKFVEGFAAQTDAAECQIRWEAAAGRGAAVQRNQGVALCQNSVIGFFDDDILFETHCMARLWSALQSDSRLGGVNAMITNQRYYPPGRISRTIFSLLSGERRQSYAGMVLGPAVNLLPEERPDLPEIVAVEWLNLGATLYRREALPDPPFQSHFKGYSLMEDLALSSIVGRDWNLANARTARIFHDSQPGDHKDNMTALSRMEIVNRYYVMTQVLRRRRTSDYGKFLLWEFFQLVVSAIQNGLGCEFWQNLRGKLQGLREIWSK